MHSKQPIIFFDPRFSEKPVVGQRGEVQITTPHPKLPGCNFVITSTIKYVYEDGSFRTCNSIYKPEDIK